MKVKLTPTQSEWQKQIKRLQRIIRTEERKGLTIPAGIIPEQPKRVTKQKIEQLRSIKPATIRAVLEEQKLGTKPSTPVDLLGRVRVKHEEEYIRHPRIRKSPEPYQPHPLTPEQRSANAKKAWETRYAKGFQKKPKQKKEYVPHPLTPEQRSEIARKAMRTRMEKGFKPTFPSLTPEQRSAIAKKAMATRMAKGYKPSFPTFTPEQRSAMGKKAWETRRAKGQVPPAPQPKEPSVPTPKPKHELPPPRKEHPDSAPAIEDTWVEIMDELIDGIDYQCLRDFYHNLVREVYNEASDEELEHIIFQKAYIQSKVSDINYASETEDKLDNSSALYYVITGENLPYETRKELKIELNNERWQKGELHNVKLYDRQLYNPKDNVSW